MIVCTVIREMLYWKMLKYSQSILNSYNIVFDLSVKNERCETIFTMALCDVNIGGRYIDTSPRLAFC